MEEVFDYGTGVPYTLEDLEVLFAGRPACRNNGPTCGECGWFDASSTELCQGPVTCTKWVHCGKCCPLTGRTNLVGFEKCPQFEIDLIMAQ